MSKKNILIIGSDLTSNGGIASVIKSYYSAYITGNYAYKLFLLKTNHYKDKGLFSEILIFFTSFLKAIYLVAFKSIGLLHIHTSANISFYRKSFFVVLGKIFRKKVVLHIHSSNFYHFFLSNNFIVKLVLPLTDCIVVLCSDWEVKLKEKYPGVTIKKIENPFEAHIGNIMPPTQSAIHFNVLFVGFFIKSKGIEDLLSLAQALKKTEIKNIKIQIAGKGELEDYIKETIHQNNLGEIIDFIGWISGDKKIETFKQADAFILTSYKEGMPISILEAMAYGLPIISTKIAGIPDIVENGLNGYLYTPGDIQGFLNAIILLKDDLGKRQTIFQNNINRVKLNAKERIFNQVDELYNKILQK